jgi:hypothetical protein
MSDWALFINGIYSSVLDEIISTQYQNPEKTLFLQPHGGGATVRLRDDVPSPEFPITLYASTTDKLATVGYAAAIVGWENKLTLNLARRQEVDAIIRQYQPDEDGLYDASRTSGSPSLNLLHVRRMVKLEAPFSVAELIKTSDGKPLSTNRSRAGGYSYVRKVSESSVTR